MGNTGDASGTYIRLYRRFQSWEWYRDAPTKVLFLHLLIVANWNEGSFKGIKIERGETIRTLHRLSTETGLSIAQCRTALSHLLRTNDITIKKAGNLRVIRVSNFLKYQDNTSDSTTLAQDSHEFQHEDSTEFDSSETLKSHRSNKDNKDKKDKKEKSASADTKTDDPAPPPGWEDDEGWSG